MSKKQNKTFQLTIHTQIPTLYLEQMDNRGMGYGPGFHTGFFAGGGGEVIVKVVLACVSTATHMSACEQPRVIWGHVPK